MKEYIDLLNKRLEEHRNPEFARQIKAYMKGQFEYFGLRSPERQEIVKNFYKENGMPKDNELKEYVGKLWYMPERDFKYIAINIMEKKAKVLDESWIDFVAELLVYESWWDTVDSLSASVMGLLLQKFPHLAVSKSEGWASYDNMWLNRMAILFQLKYKKNTDTELLARHIEKHAASKEFFHRKAIGWALREYSKTNPKWVIEFCESHELSGLSRREALRRISL